MSWSETKSVPCSLVACLFVRSNSVYKGMEMTECYDEARDARTWLGGASIVAHPPCRKWGLMQKYSTAPESEKELAIWAIERVRTWGGVVEHPASSGLWDFCLVPRGECFDQWGGYSVSIDQWHFGHEALKPTRLYIVGCPPNALPPVPHRSGTPKALIMRKWSGKPDTRRVLNWIEREHTPPLFASWLVTVARRAAFFTDARTSEMENRGKLCPICQGFFVPRSRGRQPVFCSATCRLKAFRRGQSLGI